MPTAAIAAQGGFARAATLTAEQRSASARKAVQARWRKVRAARGITVAHAVLDPVRRTAFAVVMTYSAPDAASSMTLGGASGSVHGHVYALTH